jgi:hypothetical protein
VKRKGSGARFGRRKVLAAVAGAVCVGAIGAAIAAILAGGSGGGAAGSAPAGRQASATTRRGRSSSQADRRALALVRRYQRQRAAARRRRQRRNPTSPHAIPPATRGPGAIGRTRGDKTSCRAVVHIGDSTSDGLDSPTYLPDPDKRIGAQYARVGATTWHPEISGATSIVETLPGGTNAYDVAHQLVSQGYRGCWVLALGTNDTADVAVGSSVGLGARIERMMSAIGNQPVMWVNVKSLVGSGPYAEANMERWDATLLQECSRYPNMRVFDWASVVRGGWFISDGIHYTSAGYAARARLIADALARAFPASGRAPGSGCVVT